MKFRCIGRETTQTHLKKSELPKFISDKNKSAKISAFSNALQEGILPSHPTPQCLRLSVH
jgi:hypothetical protein